MAKYSAKDVAWITIDGLNVTGVSTSIGDVREAILQETTPLGVVWPESEDTGLRRAEYSSDGFYDDATGSVNDALAEQEGVSRIVCYGLEGNTIGQKFTGLGGLFTGKYVRTVTLNEFHRAHGEYTVSGQVDEGRILHALGAETADGDTESTPVDGGASSADGGAAYLQLTAITLGTATNLVVTVRDSADDITYADLVAFDAATAVGAQRKTVAGTVERYLACDFVWTGGAGGGSTATFLAGFSRA